MASSLVADVLSAMITPAVLISAGGTLVLSTSNRLSRVVDRVRVLAQIGISSTLEELHYANTVLNGQIASRRGLRRPGRGPA